MKKPTKSIITSSLLALAFGAMSVGTTFALFTSEASTTINVGAGEVKLTQDLTIESVSELGNVAVAADANGVYTNSIGGKTYVDEDNPLLVHFEKWAPGDKAVIKITNNNLSNVTIKTRFRVSHTSTSTPDLWGALTKTYAAVDANNQDIGYKFMDWSPVEPSVSKISDVTVTITFPDHDAGEILFGDANHDNDYQNCNCSIMFTQEAVQGNAHTGSLLDQLNAALDLAAATDGRNKTMYDALQDVASIKDEAELASIGYVWGVNDDHFHYAEEGTTNEYFKICDEMPNPQTNSIYAASTWNTATVNLTGVGFDAGSASGITAINYVGAEQARTNTIRTNSATTNLTINAPLDTVHHYGAAGSLNIIAVANSSYHENGTAKFVEISKGRIALEAGSEASHIHINAKVVNNEKTDEFDKVIISYDSSVDLTEVGFSRDDVEIAAAGTLVVALQAGTETPNESTEMDYVWLTKQGIYEQIKVSDNDQSAGTVWADDSSNSAETQDAAQKIANNYVSETVRPTWNSDDTNRDLADINNATQVATAVAQEEAGEAWESMTVEQKAEAVAEKAAVVVDADQAVEAQPDKADVETGVTLFAGGSGTEKDPFLIVDYNTMQSVTTVSKVMKRASTVVASIGTSYDYNYYAGFYGSYHASFGGYDTYDEYFETEWLPYKSYFDNPNSLSKYCFKVKDGISVIDCSEDSRKWIGVTLFGDFDGNGVTFKNLVGAPLFDEVSSLETRPTIIKNFNVDNCLIMTGSYYVGAVVRVCYYDVSFEDISISGYLEANSPASFLGQGNFYDRDCNISFTRCHSSMNLVSLNAQCSGFTGNLFGSYYNKNHSCTVNLVDSYFDGSLAVGSGSRFSYLECHTATPIMYSISYTSDEKESQYSSLYSTGHTEAKDVAYLGSTKTLTKGTISLPETGDVITIAKTAGAATAKAYIIVGLNPGNFTGIYVSEEIDLSEVGDSFSTNKVKNYDVVVNDGTHNKTEIIGNTLYIYDTRYQSGYGSLTFMIVQYDSLGGIVSVSTQSK